MKEWKKSKEREKKDSGWKERKDSISNITLIYFVLKK